MEEKATQVDDFVLIKATVTEPEALAGQVLAIAITRECYEQRLLDIKRFDGCVEIPPEPTDG